MIDSIHGTIMEVNALDLVIDAGPICYRLKSSLRTTTNVTEQDVISIYVETLYPEREGPKMFGFLMEEERTLFRNLINIPKIGGSTVMTILSTLSDFEIARAIGEKDASTFEKVKGVGKKTAEMLVNELSGINLFGAGKDSYPINEPGLSYLQTQDAILALQAMGIKKAQAEKLIKSICKQYPQEYETAKIVKLCLRPPKIDDHPQFIRYGY